MERPKPRVASRWILSSRPQSQKANHRAERLHGLSSSSLAYPLHLGKPAAGFQHTHPEGDPKSSQRSPQDACRLEEPTSQSTVLFAPTAKRASSLPPGSSPVLVAA